MVIRMLEEDEHDTKEDTVAVPDASVVEPERVLPVAME